MNGRDLEKRVSSPSPLHTSFFAPSFRQSSGDLLSLGVKYLPALMSMANGGGGGGGNAAIGSLLANGLGSMIAGGGGGGGGGLRDGVSLQF